MRFASLLALALAGCTPVCTTAPRAPSPDARWAVRYDDRPADAPPIGVPAFEEFDDPSGVGVYAALTLYDASGAPISERWLDRGVTWDGATGTVDAATRLPFRMAPGRLTILLADGPRSAVSFAVATGDPIAEALAFPAPPVSGGQLLDYAPVIGGQAFATRAPTPGGDGRDVVLLDDFAVQLEIELAPLATQSLSPGRVAAAITIDGPRGEALVGLTLRGQPAGGEAASGALAWVDTTGQAVRVDLPGLRGCAEVVSLPARPEAPDTARFVALCVGDLGVSPSERADAGFVLLESVGGVTPQIVTVRPAADFADASPTHGLVALDGAWVAVAAAGDLEAGRPDALIALDVAGAAGQVLATEARTELYGAALGSGDYAEDLAELWWPAAYGGVLRWRKEGDDFVALDVVGSPACITAPPRVARALTPVPTPAP